MQRKYWHCPQCGKRWSIPADAADPDRCRDCRTLNFVPVQTLPTPVPHDQDGIGVFGVTALVWAAIFLIMLGINFTFNSDFVQPDDRYKPLVWWEVVIGALMMTVAFLVYSAPAHVAAYRRHNHGIAIALLNIFGGWTCIGWIVAIVWSAMPIDRSET